MTDIANINLNYDLPVKIAEGVYWIGFYDTQSGLHCNPYLIIDGNEAVVIDGGSRPDFPVVMMKILQAGVKPSSICALIYQHYDPDLVGSVHNFEEIIGRKDLKIISDASNNMFIRHYYVESSMTAIDAIKHRYEFSSGRRLEFINTPYAHSQGSFITYDPKTGILFTSDLFGSLGGEWELFLKLEKECRTCDNYEPQNCPNRKSYCPLPDILKFHANLIPSSRILKLAMEKITRIPATLIAPQHGSIIHNPEDIKFVSELLSSMQQVGIDKLL